MTEAFDDLREQIENRLIVPPFEHIRRRRARKTAVASVLASAAAVTAIVVGSAVVTAPRGAQPSDLRPAAPASTASAAEAGNEPTAVVSSVASVEQPTAAPAETAKPAVEGPMYLVTAPGWTVTRVDESYPPEGEMTFENGDRRLDLHWRAASSHASYVDDRAHSAGPPARIEIDGHDGVLFRYDDSADDHTALWLVGEFSFELRGNATEADFRAVAATVKAVAPAAFLAALPRDAVVPDERAAVIAEMRKDIPTPPGFDESRLDGTGVADRYQLGALVAGQLACGWFDRWVEADKAGDAATKADAAAALETSRTWSVLLEMVEPGDYPEVLWEYVDALDGRDLAAGKLGLTIRNGDYASGLGCDRT